MKKASKPARAEYERWAIVEEGEFADPLMIFESAERARISLEPGERVVRVRVTVEEVEDGMR